MSKQRSTQVDSKAVGWTLGCLACLCTCPMIDQGRKSRKPPFGTTAYAPPAPWRSSLLSHGRKLVRCGRTPSHKGRFLILKSMYLIAALAWLAELDTVTPY